MSELGATAVSPRGRLAERLRESQTVDLARRTFGYGSAKVGLALFLLLLGIAFIGPFFSPYSETEIVGLPSQDLSWSFPMGTDSLGRDLFSRFLHGGHTVIILAFLSTVLGYLVGIAVGLAAGYDRGWLDVALMRIVDIVLSLPSIILVLILVTGLGPRLWLIVVGVAATHVPRVARVVRGATQEVAVRGFVERAEARGERMPSILFREILPNVWTPIMADFGIRFSTSVLLVASLSFLGAGLQPPAADWSLMINENRTAIFEQPYAVAFPAIAIALLTIAVNLIADGFARAVGRSLNRRDLYT